RQIALAISMYAQDNDESLPPADTWKLKMSPYNETTIYDCPAQTPNGKGTVEYLYCGATAGVDTFLGGAALGDVHDPSGTLLTVDAPLSTAPILTKSATPDFQNNLDGLVDPLHAGFLAANTVMSSVAASRHNGMTVCSFLDGHAAGVAADDLLQPLLNASAARPALVKLHSSGKGLAAGTGTPGVIGGGVSGDPGGSYGASTFYNAFDGDREPPRALWSNGANACYVGIDLVENNGAAATQRYVICTVRFQPGRNGYTLQDEVAFWACPNDAAGDLNGIYYEWYGADSQGWVMIMRLAKAPSATNHGWREYLVPFYSGPQRMGMLLGRNWEVGEMELWGYAAN
ncbi:MAG TPA: hypothetical protein PLZ36_11195, partial [Armatimonadota bacterium]|nr:hypothetical protein [Armatimonadota bacterium]